MLRKVGSSNMVESSNEASLGAHEDASKQGIIFQDRERTSTCIYNTFLLHKSQSSTSKQTRQRKMVEPKVPLKKKDQVALDEEMARNLEA
ncbi:hypothetical protein Tco_0750382 [Tanacetum coccineum]|uniref:Uncharacterized protein n=1 Tax=Tanacetum coccineum TaxID=301880 RepID=A0ABQ4Z267_9ASTR